MLRDAEKNGPTLKLSAEAILPLTDPTRAINWLGPAFAKTAYEVLERRFRVCLLFTLPLAEGSDKQQLIHCLCSAVVPHFPGMASCLQPASFN